MSTCTQLKVVRCRKLLARSKREQGSKIGFKVAPFCAKAPIIGAFIFASKFALYIRLFLCLRGNLVQRGLFIVMTVEMVFETRQSC